MLGYLVIGLAMLALAACGTGTAYPWVGLLLVALGLGMGLAVPGTGLAVMASVARERSGMASATMNTLRQAGMAVGIALLGALLSGRAIVVLGDRLEELGIADAQRLATQAITAHRLPGSWRARRRAAGRAGRGLPSGYAGGRSQRPAGRRAALAPAR